MSCRNITVHLAITLLLVLFSCGKNSVKPASASAQQPPANSGLRNVLPFPFGAAVNTDLLEKNKAYRDVVVKEYSSLTAENVMKPKALHPGENTWNWAAADSLVSFAVKHGQRIHAHTLIWHKSLPPWLETFQGDTQAWERLFKDHIQTTVSHFRGKVASWDVVNEAIADDGSMRKSIWLEKLGPDYIARAFTYAHEADPSALLFYNDYGHEYGTSKREVILKLVMDLKNRNIPIHGIGMQMHTRGTIPDKNLIDAIQTAASTGLKVHISELDIAMNPENVKDLEFTGALADLQAQKYRLIVKTFNSLPAAQRFGITTWNVGDADSWIPGKYGKPDWPLPFDKNYQPKPAYRAIVEAVK